jgi:diaminohydroxyphosphoribosylaminopyrimidine deaminase/5-amino-6-(5-phosphoribosylamino)uracil reductase
VVAAGDPNPLVSGRGVAFLRARRIEVVEGVLAREAEHQNAPFFTAMRKRRPYVVLKIAASVDARVAAAPGHRTSLTGDEANRHVHRLRAEIDAIGVGSGTVLVDDPLLTPRGVFRDRPLTRVVFDSRLRTPATASVLRTLDVGPVLIATTADSVAAAPAHAAALREAGAELLAGPRHDLAAVLRTLGRREIRTLLLEGGPTVHRAAWEAGLVDAVQVLVTPHTLGPGGVRWEMPERFSLATLRDARVTPLGADVLLEGECSPA